MRRRAHFRFVLPCERLKAWVLADALAHRVYDVTRTWPADERFGLVSQMRRAAFSVPANICEGASKRGTHEFGRYLDIALGSLAEVTYGLRFARARGWIAGDEWDGLEVLRESASKMLWLLYRSVRSRPASPST